MHLRAGFTFASARKVSEEEFGGGGGEEEEEEEDPLLFIIWSSNASVSYRWVSLSFMSSLDKR